MESRERREMMKRRSMSIALGAHDLNHLEKIKSDKNLNQHMGLAKQSPRSHYDYAADYDGHVVYSTQNEFPEELVIPN